MRAVFWQVMIGFAALVALGAGLLASVAAYHIYVTGRGITSIQLFGRAELVAALSLVAAIVAISALLYARTRLR